MYKRLFVLLAGTALFLLAARAQQPGQAKIVVSSPDGKRSVSALDKVITISDTQTQKEIARLQGHTGPITTLAISPDGKFLASGSQDKTIAMWEMFTGKILWRVQGGGLVSSLTFSGDGKALTSRTADKTLTDWEVATGKVRRQVKDKK
jgi:WD40 repeat protein